MQRGLVVGVPPLVYTCQVPTKEYHQHPAFTLSYRPRTMLNPAIHHQEIPDWQALPDWPKTWVTQGLEFEAASLPLAPQCEHTAHKGVVTMPLEFPSTLRGTTGHITAHQCRGCPVSSPPRAVAMGMLECCPTVNEGSDDMLAGVVGCMVQGLQNSTASRTRT